MNRASLEVLYLPLSLSVKNRLKIWIDLFVERVGRGLGGLILLGATTAASLTATELGYAVLALLVPWILLVLSLRRAVRRDSERVARAAGHHRSRLGPLHDPASRSIFLAILTGSDEREIVYALSLVQGIGDPEILEAVSKLASHESALRCALPHSASCGCLPIPRRSRRYRDLDRGSRTRWPAPKPSRSGCGSSPTKRGSEFERLVAQGDVARIAAVLDSVEGTPSLPVAALERVVARYGASPAATERRLAAKALESLPPDEGTSSLLLKLLEDEDVEVARAAALSAGKRRSLEGVFDALVHGLARRPIRAQIRRSIARFGHEGRAEASTIPGATPRCTRRRGARFPGPSPKLKTRRRSRLCSRVFPRPIQGCTTRGSRASRTSARAAARFDFPAPKPIAS